MAPFNKLQRAEQRLAAEIFTGVAKGTKYVGFKKLEELWHWLAPAVDELYNHMNADAYTAWRSCITDVLNRDDTRRFWWLVEQFLTSMTRSAPTAWHQGMYEFAIIIQIVGYYRYYDKPLYFSRSQVLLAIDWRETETRKRICDIAWKSLPKATIETQRLGVSTSLKHVCTVLEANMNNDLKSLPERFQLEGVDVWLQRFEKQLNTLADVDNFQKSSNDVPTTNTACELNMKQLCKKSFTMGSQSFSSDAVEKVEPLIYLRTLLEFLLQYYEECITCLTPGIISLFPMLIEYANEDEFEHVDALKDIDIKNNASVLVHEYMSTLFLSEKFADSFLDVIINVSE
ncbi:hypothetical protein DICVIV_05964 [Dictyocaulus viviparus]|uniref:Proteasome activator complex subunit 4-like HEAT repeat-like domain-containing protein n=1 Tax=Dictyocaulus viviparus TaxID=29172 RepID=A0A0D8XVY7_DICVI|nr:hypothetical protein DICVIV_05964 [Dictyocaulus viviparus]